VELNEKKVSKTTKSNLPPPRNHHAADGGETAYPSGKRFHES